MNGERIEELVREDAADCRGGFESQAVAEPFILQALPDQTLTLGGDLDRAVHGGGRERGSLRRQAAKQVDREPPRARAVLEDAELARGANGPP